MNYAKVSINIKNIKNVMVKMTIKTPFANKVSMDEYPNIIHTG